MGITTGDIIITIAIFAGYFLLNSSVREILNKLMKLYGNHEDRITRIEEYLKLPPPR